MVSNIVVLQDSREQKPWDFQFRGFAQNTVTLKTGDYTLAGYEDVLRIEKKGSTGELAINLGSKSKQFYAELDRMLEYEYRYLIFEFTEETLSRFPIDSGIPKSKLSKIKINANYLISSVNKIRDKYDIEVIFAGDSDRATDEAIQIFNRVIENNGKKQIVF